MKAFFTTTKPLIEQAVKSESRKHEEGVFSIRVSREGEYTVAQGSTQQIMFLIGEVAAYGEDGLAWIEAD